MRAKNTSFLLRQARESQEMKTLMLLVKSPTEAVETIDRCSWPMHPSLRCEAANLTKGFYDFRISASTGLIDINFLTDFSVI